MNKTIPISNKYDEELQDMLIEVYMLMNHYLSGKGVPAMNSFLNWTVEIFWKKYRLSKNDILHHIYLEFITKKHFYQYDPCKLKLTTFTANYTKFRLIDLLRKYDRLKEKTHFSTVSFETLYEMKNQDEDRIGSSLHYWEKRGLPNLSNPITPEDEYMGKELQGIINDFFGEFDGQVVSGYLDRHDAAAKCNVNYNSYCKRVRRKINEFPPVLSGTGYLN